MPFRTLAMIYLFTQALGAAVWWIVLVAWPTSRIYFRAKSDPDDTLLAFGPADGLLFIGGSAIAAYGIARKRAWAWSVLCIHSGAAIYAALYCWTLTILTFGDGWLGSVLMTPSLIVLPVIMWRFPTMSREPC